MNEGKSAQPSSSCSFNHSPAAVRAGTTEEITFNCSASASFSGVHSFLAKFTKVIPSREAARSHLQRSRVAMKGSISLKKQYSAWFPWYLCITWRPLKIWLCRKILFILTVWRRVKEDIKTPRLRLYWIATPVTRLYLLHMPHTHGNNGVLAFAETRPPASNYFTPLNAFTAKPLQRPILSFSVCRTWFHSFMSLLPFPSSQRCLGCDSQSPDVPRPHFFLLLF